MEEYKVPLRDISGDIIDYAFVSKEDYDKVMARKWCKQVVKHSKSGLCYALSNKSGDTIRMHQLVMGKAPEGMVIDHINNNGLDNRRENLRIRARENNGFIFILFPLNVI